MSLADDRAFIAHAQERMQSASRLSSKELEWLLAEVERRVIAINDVIYRTPREHEVHGSTETDPSGDVEVLRGFTPTR